MYKLLILSFLFCFMQAYGEPNPVTVSKQSLGYEVRVHAQEEQFSVIFPQEPIQLGDGDDGQIVYELNLEDSYEVRYLFAYVYNSDKLGYPYSILLNRPKKGGNAQEKTRQETVDVLVRRMLSLAGQGYGVLTAKVHEELYPPGKGTLGGSYTYHIEVYQRDNTVTEITFRVFMGQEGIYITAMFGKQIHEDPNEGMYQIPFGDIRYQMWPLRYVPSREAPNVSPVPLISKLLWAPISVIFGAKNPVNSEGKIDLPLLPAIWDRITWGKYSPKRFFGQAELSFKKE